MNDPQIAEKIHTPRIAGMSLDRLQEIRRIVQADPEQLTQSVAQELVDQVDALLADALQWRTVAQNVANDLMDLRDGPLEQLTVENATLKGRCIAAEANLAEADKTGRALGKKLVTLITQTIENAWPAEATEVAE